MTTAALYDLYVAAGALTTDSRRCVPGALFLALRGAKYDGNRFALAALRAGCSYAIISVPKAAVDPSGAYHDRLIVVADTLETYHALARYHRQQYSLPVIAITGTNGKTTTKELTLAVLRSKYTVLATEGNYNNDIGVPQTLLALSEKHDIAIIEMGASHPGDIASLAATALPTHGVITNVGLAHLAGFGSSSGVKRAKGELYEFLSQAMGKVFLDSSNGTLVQMARRQPLDTIPYVGGSVAATSPTLSVRLTDGPLLTTHLVGDYNLSNVLAAVTIGQYFDVPMPAISAALAAYEPNNARSQRVYTADNELIVDAYNANPSSMAAAIETFAHLSSPREKMLILGEMAELGAASSNAHQGVLDLLQTYGFRDVYLVGTAFHRLSPPYPCFETTADLLTAWQKDGTPHDRCILIKGSNAVGLSTLVDSL